MNEIGKLMRRTPLVLITALVAAVVVTSGQEAAAGPVRVPVQVCSEEPIPSFPNAWFAQRNWFYQCRIVWLWIGCRDPRACADLNRAMRAGFTEDIDPGIRFDEQNVAMWAGFTQGIAPGIRFH